MVELAIILMLLLVNGVFAMAEIAVVSARKARLRQRAEQGSSRARAALDLADSPNRFLATVQIGITLVGIFAGAFGGATLAGQLTGPISTLGIPPQYAEKIAFGLVVAVITYFSLVIGELVPKRIGLSNPEGIAMIIAKPMSALSRIASPLVTLLGTSTDALLRLFRFKPSGESTVNEEEVRILMQEGVRAGAFHKVEGSIIHNALDLDLLLVSEIMTPRPKVIWLNQNDTHDLIWHKIVVSNHSNYPVYEDNRDNVVGFVSVKAIYAHLAAGLQVNLRNLAVPPLVVPESQNVLSLVETFKQSGKHIAVVTDEFGSIVGLVTLNDVMEALVGELPALDQRAKPAATRRDDGSWLVDGMIDLESVERALPGFTADASGATNYQTLAGYLVKHLGHIPKDGETFETQGYIFEILDMDRHRIDKVLVIRANPSESNPLDSRSASPT